MTVLTSTRKDASPTTSQSADEERVPFAQVLAQATVLMLACPLTPSTKNLISTTELARMRPDTIVINISRGGLVDERAVVAALRERKIWGYGTDVFETEPAGSAEESVLLS